MRAWRMSSRALAAGLALLLIACSEEKAQAIQNLTTQLDAAIEQIDGSAEAYWERFQPKAANLDDDALVDSLAGWIAAEPAAGRTVSLKDYSEQFQQLVRDLRGNESVRESNPYRRPVRELRNRSQALADAVRDLDRGSYFAAPAVERLETHFAKMAERLLELHDILMDADTLVRKQQVADAAAFAASMRTSHEAIASGAVGREAIRPILEEALHAGFDEEAARRAAVDDLDARLVATAEIAADLAVRSREYRHVSVADLLGFANDLAALADDAPLPDVLASNLKGKVARVNDLLKKLSLPPDTGVEQGTAPAATRTARNLPR